MAKKAVVLTPEQIAAGVAKNANEYNARVEALRALHSTAAYNPPVDQSALDRAAVEATRGAGPAGKALPIYAQGGVIGADVKLGGVDREAEALAKNARGGRPHGKAQVEEGEGAEGGGGDGGVQAGDAAQRFQARPASPFAQAGGGHSAVPVWTEQTYEADTKEAVSELVPADAKAVTYKRVWKATALVKQ